MPPKETQPHSVFVSVDGGETYTTLGKVSEAHLFVDDLIPEEGAELPFVKPDEALMGGTLTLSCTFNMRSNPSLFMFLWTGKWPSNNWLKMHGYPMRRKRNVQRRT